MRTQTKRSVLWAVIALSLALVACADAGPKTQERSSAGQAVGNPPAPTGSSEKALPAGRVMTSGAAEPNGQASGNSRLTAEEQNTIEIVRRCRNSVVFVTNVQFVHDFFSSSEQEVPRGSGSGFVWDDQAMLPFSKSTSFKVKRCSSIGLKPVSLRMLKIKAYFFLQLEIILFSCSVVAI